MRCQPLVDIAVKAEAPGKNRLAWSARDGARRKVFPGGSERVGPDLGRCPFLARRRRHKVRPYVQLLRRVFKLAVIARARHRAIVAWVQDRPRRVRYNVPYQAAGAASNRDLAAHRVSRTWMVYLRARLFAEVNLTASVTFSARVRLRTDVMSPVEAPCSSLNTQLI